jgi:hypothetical protein
LKSLCWCVCLCAESVFLLPTAQEIIEFWRAVVRGGFLKNCWASTFSVQIGLF